MTRRRFEKLSNKWKLMQEKGEKFDSLHKDSKNKNPYWKKWAKYGKQLFKEESRLWRKKFDNEILKKQYPYGAGGWILDALFLLIERTYIYWTHGYNVWSADPHRTEQINSVSQAMLLVEELREVKDDCTFDFPNENDKKLLEQLIKILTNESFNWYD